MSCVGIALTNWLSANLSSSSMVSAPSWVGITPLN